MYRFDTLCVHAGQKADPATGAISVPIYMTNAYAYESTQQAADRFDLKDDGYIYTRLGNPTTTVLEERMAALEGGVGAVAAASGHAAEMLGFLTLLSAGDHVVSSANIYGGTYNILAATLPRYGIETTFVNPDDPENFRKAMRPNTKLVYVEQLGNPVINIVDVDAVAEIAHSQGVALMVDNTFPSPYLYRPFEHGADIVVASATKYIGGHGTTLGGILVDSGKFDWKASGKYPTLTEPDPCYHGAIHTDLFGSAAFINKARVAILRDVGATISPFNSFMLLNGLETLPLRMDRMVSSVRTIIEHLKQHPGVSWISYPEVETSPYYDLAKRDFPRGCSGTFAFGIRGGVKNGAAFINNLNLFYHASNLADSHSIVTHPASTTHSQMSPEEQIAAGVLPEMIRVSVGLEDPQDLIDDIDQSLEIALNV